jgi:hypothetical protein
MKNLNKYKGRKEEEMQKRGGNSKQQAFVSASLQPA